jgi:hypothetical protein
MIRLTCITSGGATRSLLPDGATRQIAAGIQSSSTGRLTAEATDQSWAASIRRVCGEINDVQPGS